MTDPKRLVLDCTRVEEVMLRSATADVPPSDLHENLYGALLVGGVAASTAIASASAASIQATVGSVAPPGAATTETVVGAGVTTSTVATGVSVVALKWAGLVVVAGSLAIGLHRTRTTPEPRRVQDPVIHVHEEVRASPMTPHAEAIDIVPVPLVAPSSSAVAPKLADPSKHSTPIAPAAPLVDQSIARELRLVDDARAALAAGDPSRAIEALDRRDLDFAGGQLSAEGLALRIEAYSQRHDGPRVRSLADQFVSTYPDHPLAAHVRSLAGSEGSR